MVTASDRHRVPELVAEVRVNAGEHVAIARHVDRDDGRLGRQRCDVVVGNNVVVDAQRAYEPEVTPMTSIPSRDRAQWAKPIAVLLEADSTSTRLAPNQALSAKKSSARNPVTNSPRSSA